MPRQVNIDQANPLETRIGRYAAAAPRRRMGARVGRRRNDRLTRHLVLRSQVRSPCPGWRGAAGTDAIAMLWLVLCCASPVVRRSVLLPGRSYRWPRHRPPSPHGLPGPQEARICRRDKTPIENAQKLSIYREVLLIVFVLFLSHWGAGNPRFTPYGRREAWAASEGRGRGRGASAPPAGRHAWNRRNPRGQAPRRVQGEGLAEALATGQAPNSAATDNSTSRSACGRPRPGPRGSPRPSADP